MEEKKSEKLEISRLKNTKEKMIFHMNTRKNRIKNPFYDEEFEQELKEIRKKKKQKKKKIMKTNEKLFEEEKELEIIKVQAKVSSKKKKEEIKQCEEQKIDYCFEKIQKNCKKEVYEIENENFEIAKKYLKKRKLPKLKKKGIYNPIEHKKQKKIKQEIDENLENLQKEFGKKIEKFKEPERKFQTLWDYILKEMVF